ncbi:MAG: type II secretion system major pseudopilin GspG [Candidatus Omnitrophica bacterium]|nr:type II secretion system major pseudopilin GspG [Candidatus Omnitrophota bacterium]
MRIKKYGFTLIEMMLVVIIIGVLASIVMPRLLGRGEQAKAAAVKADINASIPLALDLFSTDIGRFPTTEEGLAALRTNPGALEKWKGPYLKKDPQDPWGKEYVYKSPGSHNTDYDLYSLGPNGIDDGGSNDDIGNW